MLISTTFSYFRLLVTLALLSRAFITAPAHIPPPPSSPFCSLLSDKYLSFLSKKEPPSNITSFADVSYGRNLTLISFTLPTDASSSATFTFTIDYSPEDLEEPFPASNVSFVLAMLETAPSSALRSMQVFSFRCIPSVGCSQLEIPCNTRPPQKLDPQMQASIESDDGHEESIVKDEFSFTYLASIAELSVQVVYYRDGLKISQAFSLSLLSDATLSSSSESAAFFVGYIAAGEARILSTPPSGVVVVPIGANNDDNTIHVRVMAWVVVGIIVMGTLLGLGIFFLYIMKGRKRRPQVVSSPPLQHGSPPLARRAPFSHHDLESRETPMMSVPSLPPPIHSNAFHISGTASWLKQPNPR